MRKFFVILAISVAIAILYGADTRAAPGKSGGAGLILAESDRLTGRPSDTGHDS